MATPETSTSRLSDDEIDATVLQLLLSNEAGSYPWTLQEVANEIGDPIVATDAISRLRRRGLLHRLDGGFVFPSLTARHAFDLLEHQ